MENKVFELEFDGYWLEKHSDRIPNKSGIYCVYACVYFKDRNSVGIRDLLFIGESDSVRNSIQDPNQKQSWFDHLVKNQLGQTLCYTFARFDDLENREKLTNALIQEHDPLIQNECTGDRSFDNIVFVRTTGCNSNLKKQFRV